MHGIMLAQARDKAREGQQPHADRATGADLDSRCLDLGLYVRFENCIGICWVKCSRLLGHWSR